MAQDWADTHGARSMDRQYPNASNSIDPASAGPDGVGHGSTVQRDCAAAPGRQSIRARLAGDVRLSIICLCGALAVVSILPFAVYRMVMQQWLAALVDLVIVAVIAGINLYALRTGRSAGPAAALVVSNSICVVIATSVLGLAGALWMYTSVIMNFFLVERRYALPASLLLIAVVAPLCRFDETVHLFSYVTTAVLICLFSTIFAARSEGQRQQLDALASQDPLTGAGNRRAMERELAAFTCAHRKGPPWRRGRPLHAPAIVVIDLDHFKQVNDQHGHETGDDVLVSFVRLLRSSLRRDDYLYRYGGEEFVLLLGHGRPALESTLSRLHERVRRHLRCPSGPVTVSMGAALLRDNESWTTWLARADAALYAAKRDGRDRVVVEGSSLPT